MIRLPRYDSIDLRLFGLNLYYQSDKSNRSRVVEPVAY